MKQQFLSSFLLMSAYLVLISCKQKVEIKLISKIPELKSIKTEDFTLANYGNVPYGQTIYSKVRLGDPVNGCSSLENTEDDQYAQILLVRRGDCTFLQKTKQAELNGAKLLLIADSLEEQENQIVMVADHSSITHIPTIMLEKTVGEVFIKILESGQSIVLSITFEKPDQSNIANVDFWLDSYNKRSYEFLKFAYENSSLSKILSTNSVVFTPHYVIWYCFECEANNYEENVWENVDEFCLSKGRYCNPDPDRTDFYNGPMVGTDVVREDWRQICIYEKYKDQVEHDFDKSLWIQYMIQFYNQCIQESSNNLEECGDSVMKDLGIDINDIKKCQSQNIVDKNSESTIITNLEQQKMKFIEEEIMVWPSLFINNLNYRVYYFNYKNNIYQRENQNLMRFQKLFVMLLRIPKCHRNVNHFLKQELLLPRKILILHVYFIAFQFVFRGNCYYSINISSTIYVDILLFLQEITWKRS